jgi:hypothetical protein
MLSFIGALAEANGESLPLRAVDAWKLWPRSSGFQRVRCPEADVEGETEPLDRRG